MKRIVGLVVLALVLATGAAVAQQAPAQPGTDPGHQMPMAGGMCPMMGGTMGAGGMMGGQSDSPRMMQMRGEMMKAMGDIMLKHGKEMAEGQKP